MLQAQQQQLVGRFEAIRTLESTGKNIVTFGVKVTFGELRAGDLISIVKRGEQLSSTRPPAVAGRVESVEDGDTPVVRIRAHNPLAMVRTTLQTDDYTFVVFRIPNITFND